MTAKEARALAEKQMKVIDGKNKDQYDFICKMIHDQIINDATVTHIDIASISSVVKAILQDKHHQYTVEYYTDRNESWTRISWDI